MKIKFSQCTSCTGFYKHIMNLKNIHIGEMIEKRVTETEIEISRICNFMKCTEKEINEMYHQKNLPTDILLKWCKLLEYDFFRIYSQHLILYSPPASEESFKKQNTELPQFRKNVYTQEIIDFILEQISSGEMTKTQVITRYNIPKTTLYKWISKYSSTINEK